MVSPHNLHRHVLWGFFFACPPLLSAEIPDRSIDRSHHLSCRDAPPMNAWSHARGQEPREDPPDADPRAVPGGAVSTARSTPEPHGGIISGWRALRSAHSDTDPMPWGRKSDLHWGLTG